jgi:hypothetical protein
MDEKPLYIFSRPAQSPPVYPMTLVMNQALPCLCCSTRYVDLSITGHYLGSYLRDQCNNPLYARLSHLAVGRRPSRFSVGLEVPVKPCSTPRRRRIGLPFSLEYTLVWIPGPWFPTSLCSRSALAL